MTYLAGSKRISVRPSDPDTMTDTAPEAIASSSGKNFIFVLLQFNFAFVAGFINCLGYCGDYDDDDDDDDCCKGTFCYVGMLRFDVLTQYCSARLNYCPTRKLQV